MNRNHIHNGCSTFDIQHTQWLFKIILSIHKRNLRFLVEMLKTIKGISPLMINEIFDCNEGNNYNLRNPFYFRLPIMKTVLSGLETLSYLGPKLREIFPPEIKVVDFMLECNDKMRLWNLTNCPCRICKKYIHKIGFTQNFNS